MSGGRACHCGEEKEAINPTDGANRPGRLWRILQYRCNHSAFNGYHYTSSAYSSLMCLRCGHTWRTKANYVHLLGNAREDEKFISSGYSGHAEAMAALGRTPHTGG